MSKTCKDIRAEFIAFFEERGHTFVPSSPLLPAEDPTLLFTNAGMNQFKNIFLARETRDYVRAVNSQKCIRAGGKHNDLEDVGHDCYHHTFFEMLGNWSFGDYFKGEAIQWAWELLTEVWSLPKDRLWATVFAGDRGEGLSADAEAEQLWKDVTDIDPSHILAGDRKDNFWEMSETGPCGPCSEIHIDMTDDGTGGRLVNAGDPRVIELWNLVFIQYNRGADGVLSDLPAHHVDTGMGLERVGAVLNGKKSNYATDLFVPIIERIETLTDHRYGAASGLDDRFDVTGEDDIADVACRVIADHARTLAFAIAGGVIPSNEGRGYVLRRILRRAARYGRQYLKIAGPFLAALVPTIVQAAGGVFGELADRKDYIIETIRGEEESFGRTLDRGIELFAKQAAGLVAAGAKQLPGDVAFDLYATYGFPIDLTQLMAVERGLDVDLDGYDSAMAEHREVSGASEKFRAEELPDLPTTDDSAKYAPDAIDAKVLGWVMDGVFVDAGELATGREAAVVLDRTNFYAEQGGQVGDAGRLTWGPGRFAVRDTQAAGEGIMHVGVVEAGPLHAGRTVRCEVDPSRTDTMRNHTATHLMNWALREVLGEHVNQAGSVVAPDHLRFDFNHNQAVTPEQLAEAERLVNERVLADEAVAEVTVPLAEAKKISGVRAVFAEQYPDPVRVVSIGSGGACAAEFCGGTHLRRTGRIGLFKIISEESVAKGVRRITAVTGRAAVRYVQQLAETVQAAAAALRIRPEELPERVAGMQKEIKQLRKGPAKAAGAVQPDFVFRSDDGKVVVGQLKICDPAQMRNVCDRLRQSGAEAIFVGGAAGGKVTLVAMVDEALAAGGVVRADEWVKAAAPIVGGGGGGRDTLAQAGGKDPEKLPEALSAAADWIRRRLT